MPVKVIVTGGTAADCSQALPLIEVSRRSIFWQTKPMTPMKSRHSHGTGNESGNTAKSNRREKREYDRALYKLRHLVENGFLDFKQWRGVATRYAKNSLSYLAICQIRAMVIWTKLI